MKKKMIPLILLCACLLAQVAQAGESFTEIMLDIKVDAHSVVALADGSFFLAGDQGERGRTAEQPAYAMVVQPDGTIRWRVLEAYNDEGANYFSGVSRGSGSFYVSNDHVRTGPDGEPVYETIMTEISLDGEVTERLALGETSWLLPSREGYIIRTPGTPGPTLTNYTENHAVLWQTECAVPFVPLGICAAGDGYYAYGSIVESTYKGALIKLSQQGEVLWTVQTQGDDNQYNDCAVLTDGNIVVIGNNSISGGADHATVTCYAPDGAVVWAQAYGANDVDRFFAIIALDDGGFLTAGRYYQAKEDYFKNVFVVHDAQGDVVRRWTSEPTDQLLLSDDVSLHRTQHGYFAVTGASTMGLDSRQVKTIIQRIDID